MITEKDVGQRVKDGAGRVGVLRDVITDYEDPAELPGERQKRHAAFLSPEGGGREWIAPPASVTRIH
ncbi:MULTISPECIES: hypothetical protein [unclassified Streptomyces]|uniref:hypothetical protein n=1 Tax=unclassified Streptomyces TaxID=2593676 RepID=UPI0008852195|nr:MULTISPECIES: hypothetical protein [unclassified Streptomyces]PBC82967.1 hypothetical protein BX261_2885 [Streptomyces sp. 2321.6]SDR45980.1 hypothetical protein SAMN05216511_4318 [Streptomyces sp. KS_16]SEC78717.1 hypothetical protein SAMN05428940_2888 [Streptomyces sp. 2133.1]SNC69043.1 hypothetical protein SAMN06272741_2882 [Streptomyces sp. 2114.4]